MKDHKEIPPPYFDRFDHAHWPSERDAIWRRLICGALIERGIGVLERPFVEVLLVEKEGAWHLPSCDPSPGMPTGRALYDNIVRQLGRGCMLYGPKDVPSGHLFEEFLYTPLGWTHGLFHHVQLSVFHVQLIDPWKPIDNKSFRWIQWNDLFKYRTAPEFRNAIVSFLAMHLVGVEDVTNEPL